MKFLKGAVAAVLVASAPFLSVAGASPARAQQAALTRLDCVGLILPLDLGAFGFTERYQFEEAERGVSLTYRIGEARADLFVYRGTGPAIPDGASSELAWAEFERAHLEILADSRLRRERVPVLRDNGTLTLDSWPPQFETLYALYETGPEDRPWLTFLFLTGYRDHFFKVVTRVPEGQYRQLSRSVDVLMIRLGETLYPP